MKHDFQQRRQNRIDNAKKKAVMNQSESNSLFNSASEMASHIPMGQPILLGHHSEKADRRYRDKIGNKFSKAFEKMNKAEFYERKAKTIEKNDAIYLDDPEALQKLEAKLTALKDLQEFMKAVNNCIRRKDLEGFLKLPNATAELWEHLNSPDVMGDCGFACYRLRNTSAKIRQVQKQFDKLKSQALRKVIDKWINGVRIYENREANRLQVIFTENPREEIKRRLKQNGFRWSPSQGVWQRHISNSALSAALEILS